MLLGKKKNQSIFKNKNTTCLIYFKKQVSCFLVHLAKEIYFAGGVHIKPMFSKLFRSITSYTFMIALFKHSYTKYTLIGINTHWKSTSLLLVQPTSAKENEQHIWINCFANANPSAFGNSDNNHTCDLRLLISLI